MFVSNKFVNFYHSIIKSLFNITIDLTSLFIDHICWESNSMVDSLSRKAIDVDEGFFIWEEWIDDVMASVGCEYYLSN